MTRAGARARRPQTRTGRPAVHGVLAGDEGSGTVLVLVGVLALSAATAGGLLLGGAVGARHRVEAAADLAALAAVQHDCDRAAEAAARAGAVLTRCQLGGAGEAAVEATLPLRGWLARWGPLHAVSRAGPS